MIKRKSETIKETRENMRGGIGTISIEHFFTIDEIKANCRLCSKMTMAPGTSIGLHKHEKEDEIYLVLKGKALLSDGTIETIIEAGDSSITGKGESHSIKNIGEDNLEIIAIIMKYQSI
ncbi:MAG: cupin [Candidatus Margulisiibacteriota bacterium]|nr:MAG: cupin [Candidatus Margulisbacteria bacterium GWD2_39_127]OGI04412.1 MAG: cupin [Candidatus Margulisbacteria bacterium GWF2_38_17]OGI07346.1 MAG: cupin [Candidatus Margulisbacteria bacterium GWE2_39_32]PZM80078.1 MAG: cupin [Candidatus Margulisiibacteriota bacterium]HAR62851.1 cupin [Candidatus Margulisiibacteriota bacterium]